MVKVCKWCSKEFSTDTKQRKFCGQVCYGKWRSKNIHPGISYVKNTCPICLEIFEVPLSNKTKKYCSRKCYLIFCKGKTGEKNPFFGKSHSQETIEKLKSKTFKHTKKSRKKMSIARKGRKFSISHRKAISKALYKNSPYKTWKEKVRKSFEYKNWRKLVFERDEYACQKCGKIGGYLEAHHLNSFKDYEELRFEVKNGQTLCKKCHRSITSQQMIGNKNGLRKIKKPS